MLEIEEKVIPPMTEAEYYILLALMEPMHGYALMTEIASISGGRVVMGPGTLYGVLTRMRKECLIRLAADDARRKSYALTNLGLGALKSEYDRLSAMVRDGEKRFGGGEEHGA